MTGTNHLLAGATIGLVTNSPLAAVSVAFISHFVMDALPHFGVEYDEELKKRPGIFRYVVSVDAVLAAFVLLLAIIYAFNQSLWIVPISALVALSPDFVWVYRYVFLEEFGKKPPSPKKALTKFHKDIQRYERHWGIFVEAAFFAGFILLIGWLA